jgi:hypothetical protein
MIYCRRHRPQPRYELVKDHCGARHRGSMGGTRIADNRIKQPGREGAGQALRDSQSSILKPRYEIDR